MNYKQEMFITLNKGIIFNNFYIDENNEKKLIFKDIKKEIDETPLNKLYLNQIEKKIIFKEESLLIIEKNENLKMMEIAQRKDFDMLTLFISINKLDNLNLLNSVFLLEEIEELSDKEKKNILSFEKEGLVVTRKEPLQNYIVFSDILIYQYINDFKEMIEHKRKRIDETS